MTSLEQQTFADGFLVGLLGVHVDRAQNALAYRAVLFDGGRPVRTLNHQGCWITSDPAPYDDLRRFVLKLLPPPHVLVVHGRGGAELLAQAVPAQALAELRILDLVRTATALRDDLPARPSAVQLAQAFGIPLSPDAESSAAPVGDALLWAVIAAAGYAGLSWPELLTAAARARPAVVFERYAFNAETLAALPHAPGVYLMEDAAGATLYVGKSADVARRLNEYFRPTRDLPPKLQAIRARIHDFEYRLVGSELEALLLENRLITQRQPAINVQRQVAEGTSRYGFPLLPVAVVAPSAKRAAAEVFIFAGHNRAVQVRLDSRRAPGRALTTVLAYYREERPTLAKAAGLTDWGVEGHEICGRYFARYRDRLHWMELPAGRPAADVIRALQTLAAALQREPSDAAMLRWDDVISAS